MCIIIEVCISNTQVSVFKLHFLTLFDYLLDSFANPITRAVVTSLDISQQYREGDAVPI